MQDLDFKFRHHGIAVRNIRTITKFLEALGYSQLNQAEDKLQNVNVSEYMHPEKPAIEIVWPRDNTDGPLNDILKKGNGQIYHTCYSTKNIENSIQSIEVLGFKIQIITSPKPAELFAGKRVCFIYIHEVGLIELLEE